jgi:protein-S-isoprenylcysteine O-methyltransferase Ste14
MQTLYRWFGCFGLVSIFGSLICGFRHAPGAPAGNIVLAILLYAAWIGVHLGMTTSWFKARAWGAPHGKPRERRVFILVSVTTWLLLYAIHPSVPGPSLASPGWLQFTGVVLTLMGTRSFFDGLNPKVLDGMLGVPGAAMGYSHGSETPLMTDGPYATVRHPMYRAAIFAGLASLLIHPNMGQLLWGAMIGATFIAFIPIEERQLTNARGEAYLAYCRRTPYRLFPGLW